MPRMMV